MTNPFHLFSFHDIYITDQHNNFHRSVGYAKIGSLERPYIVSYKRDECVTPILMPCICFFLFIENLRMSIKKNFYMESIPYTNDSAWRKITEKVCLTSTIPYNNRGWKLWITTKLCGCVLLIVRGEGTKNMKKRVGKVLLYVFYFPNFGIK